MSQVVGEPVRGEVAHTSETEFSGYVKRLPQVKPDEKLVSLSVSFDPLRYNAEKLVFVSMLQNQLCGQTSLCVCPKQPNSTFNHSNMHAVIGTSIVVLQCCRGMS